MNEAYERLMKEWKLCFSTKRKLDYYFNARTGVSLWTFDEVKENIENELFKERNKGVEILRKDNVQTGKT